MELKKYKICPSCREHNRPTSLECRKCEADLTGVRVIGESELQELEAEQGSASDAAENTHLVRVCEECGTENPPQARKCTQCGEEISDILPRQVLKKENTAYRYELTSVDGMFHKKIEKEMSVIGREADLQEYLGTKRYVSRVHAELTAADGKVFIKNLSGTNKTFVNNEIISESEPYELKNGDEIGLGGKVIDGSRQEDAAYFLFQGAL